jgi:LytS/YehU family sensor histidine kinase
LAIVFSNSTLLYTDICFCLFFSALSLFGGFLTTRIPERFHFEKYAYIFWIVALFGNLLLVFAAEAVMPDNIRSLLEDSDNSWISAYIFGLIDPLLALVYVVDEYHKRNALHEKENARLRMIVLKMQLNPHFVFNSLSILTALIEEDRKKAVDYTIRLSRIYRYFIRNIDKELTTMYDSIEFAKNYMALIQVRFPNIKLDVERFAINTSDYVVANSLLILLENAIKHNMPGEGNPLTISIGRPTKNTLSIKNNLIGGLGKSVTESTHIGLKNLSDRTTILCGRDIEICKSDHFFEVKIPIINKTESDEEDINY